jgi:hypothetical protein
MPGGAKICQTCEQRHLEALALLSTGQLTAECSECGKSAEELRRECSQMAVHYEAGRYRAMCMACDAVYVRKRRELYAGTDFAHQHNL